MRQITQLRSAWRRAEPKPPSVHDLALGVAIVSFAFLFYHLATSLAHTF